MVGSRSDVTWSHPQHRASGTNKIYETKSVQTIMQDPVALYIPSVSYLCG